MSMDTIKIIFFDIDGTLIDMKRKQISEKMLETLIRLKERNIILCLSTGRGPMTLPHFDGWEPDVFLTFNGSYCYNRQQAIYRHPIPKEDAKEDYPKCGFDQQTSINCHGGPVGCKWNG